MRVLRSDNNDDASHIDDNNNVDDHNVDADVDVDEDEDVDDALCVCDKKLLLVKYCCVCIRSRFSLCLHHNIIPVASKKLTVTPQ